VLRPRGAAAFLTRVVLNKRHPVQVVEPALIIKTD